MGLITPSGLRRLGREIPFIAFDAAHLAAMATLRPLAAARVMSSMTSFIRFAQSAVQQQLAHSTSSSSSVFDVKCMLATTAAPDFGIPSTARRVTLNPYLEPLDDLLLFPIIGRHMQELVISDSHTFTGSELTLIALRFPFLRSLHMENLALANTTGQYSLPSNWGLTNDLQFPTRLRVFIIRRKISPPEAVQTFLQALPLQCPLLQELELGIASSSDCDLTPLLSLPHLTHLALPPRDSDDADPSTSTLHGAVVQQLTKLEYLRLLYLHDPFHVQTYLSTAHVRLRELPLRTFDEAVLQAIADRTPHLLSLSMNFSEGVLHSWPLVDHSVLLKFHSLRKLHYSQQVVEYGNVTPIGERCITAHGSLGAHVGHVLAVLSQLRSLTCLKLESFYVPLTARSMHTNAAYFKSFGLSGGILPPELAEKATATADAHAAAASISSSKAISEPLHPVIQLSAYLPQLIELSLRLSSASHLPSLAFLAHLPHLQSLSLNDAHYLPIESLYDLHHVSSSLTHLCVINCFPVDSHGRSIYLMHDILQPLQLSQPVTQLVTIQFPTSMRNSNYQNGHHSTNTADADKAVAAAAAAAVPKSQPFSDDTNYSSPVAAVLAFNVPVPMINPTTSSSSSSSSSSSPSSVIPPRHSSWYEIRRYPPPTSSPPNVLSPLEVARLDRCNPDLTLAELEADEEMLEFCIKEAQRIKEFEAKRTAPYRLIFDSFTACARHSSNETSHVTLTSLLLPHLQHCEIQHNEPNQYQCCFTYDRLQLPRHRLRLKGGHYHSDERWRELQAGELQRMYAGYGLRKHDADRFELIQNCDFTRFLQDPPCEPCVRELRE